MTSWNPIWGTGDQGHIADTFIDSLPGKKLKQKPSMMNLYSAATDANQALGAARRTANTNDVYSNDTQNATDGDPYGLTTRALSSASQPGDQTHYMPNLPSQAGPAPTPAQLQAMQNFPGRARRDPNDIVFDGGGWSDPGYAHPGSQLMQGGNGNDALNSYGEQLTQSVRSGQTPPDQAAQLWSAAVAARHQQQGMTSVQQASLDRDERVANSIASSVQAAKSDPTAMLSNSIGRGDPSSELAQPGDPGYTAANPVFRPPPQVQGQRNTGAANVADNVAQQVIQQAAEARARGNPRANDAVASLAWQREAAANGNPSGDTSAPQAYIDSWNGMLSNGENVGPLGSMYAAATQNAQRRVAAEQAAAQQQSARQNAGVRQMAPDIFSTANSQINRLTQPPAAANGAPKVNQATGEPTGLSYQGRPVNASDLVYRGQPINPNDLVYRGQPAQRENYSATETNDPVGRAMASATGAPDPFAEANSHLSRLTQPAGAPAAPTGQPPQRSGDHRAYARSVAQYYGLDPDIFERQITQESGWKVNAKSGVGAQGLGQFMPGTAKQYGVDVNDPYSSLDGAARYMADNLKANKGNYRLALAAYNAGQGNVDKYGEGVFDADFAHGQTRDYVDIILGKK